MPDAHAEHPSDDAPRHTSSAAALYLAGADASGESELLPGTVDAFLREEAWRPSHSYASAELDALMRDAHVAGDGTFGSANSHAEARAAGALPGRLADQQDRECESEVAGWEAVAEDEGAVYLFVETKDYAAPWLMLLTHAQATDLGLALLSAAKASAVRHSRELSEHWLVAKDVPLRLPPGQLTIFGAADPERD